MPVRDLLAFDCQTSASTEFSLFHDTALQDCGGRHKPVAGEPDAGRVNQMTQREARVAYHGGTVTGSRVCPSPSPHIKTATVNWGGLGRSTAQVKTPLRLCCLLLLPDRVAGGVDADDLAGDALWQLERAGPE